MNPLFQISTRKYDEEIPLIRKAMTELENVCKIKNGYKIGEPFTSFLRRTRTTHVSAISRR